MADHPNVAHIELHDASIRSLILRSGGKGVLYFSHLAVYHQVDVERFDIWSYRAELRMDGITKLEVDGPVLADDYIIDARVLDDHGAEIDLVWLLKKYRADIVQIRFFSGSLVLIKVAWVHINLTSAIEEIEHWVGPLTS